MFTIVSFVWSFCLCTPMATAMESDSNNPLTDDIVTIVQTVLPYLDEADILNELDNLYAQSMEKDVEAQQADCAQAQLMFTNGLLLLLLTVFISRIASGDKCETEACIGDLCVCTEDDSSNPLGGLNNILRPIAVFMLALGAINSLNCVSEETPTTSTTPN
jgi:hypothetical protein